jgi:gamma-glutamyl-gamma-aminobutyrate hydrolase PuuD
MRSDLSDELEVLARTDHEEPTFDPDDYIVEAFKHKTLPIAGVQWHPEELYDRFSIETVIALLHGEAK